MNNQCDICETHKTDCGVLDSILQDTQKEFGGIFERPELMKLIICRFEQYKLDKRTQQIQDYKKQNIKSINDR